MSSWRRAIGYGIVAWLLPFVVAVAAGQLRTSWRSLFESIMAVAVAATVVVLALRYFHLAGRATAAEGLKLGLVWLALSVLIDLPLMLSPPLNYTLAEYLADVGVTYLMMPIIAGGIAGAASSTRAFKPLP